MIPKGIAHMKAAAFVYSTLLGRMLGEAGPKLVKAGIGSRKIVD